MHRPMRTLGALLMGALVLSGCGPEQADSGPISVEYDKFQLANGLDVILHVDRSDPVVAVAMTFHVGSAREVPGRTGFAHMFEHLFFLDSENLGPGGLDRLMTRMGTSTNGSTSRDRTNYFEVVPRDALEKALWAESDKLGFFINTVTEATVAKEKQVVKNEKRQGVDNQPYGHANHVIDNALYPEGHPYRWQVIGSLEDLEAATLADAKEFHERWYGPNNATLVVAGDIDVAQTRAWIEKYFGEIPSRPMPEAAPPESPALPATRLLMHEDNFARLPQLTLAWHTVPVYHPDSYALDLLASLLTDGKRTPFYRVIVEEQQLAPGVSAFNGSQELAGRFTLQIRAHDGKDLNEVMAGVDSAFARFERDGIMPGEMERIKARYESSFYGRLSSVIGKAFQLAQYNIFASSPGYLSEDLSRALAVTEADVRRVYEQYLKGRPYVAASFVPRGQASLALAGSERAQVVEEPIVAGQGEVAAVERGEIPRTPSSFDRSVEPPFGPQPTLAAPAVTRGTLDNGLSTFLVEDREIPLVQFELRMKGGLLLEDPSHAGVANLLAETMKEGTATKTPDELEAAIDLLGATITVSADRESFSIRGATLARNFKATLALVEEILLEPRWDPERFELARRRVSTQLRQQSANPTALAANTFRRLVYGEHILAMNPMGTPESVAAASLDDLKAYHATALVPRGAGLLVAGAVTEQDVSAAVEGLASRWSGDAVSLPTPPAWSPDRAGLYFLDVPGAAQSVLSVGFLAMPESDSDFYPATVMNFRLGGGGFASELTQVLREQKGYTYGVRSGFGGGAQPGPFSITSSVRSNATFEALELIRDILAAHGPGFGADDLEATRGYLLRSNAMAFETLGAKLGILRAMSDHGFGADYVLQREAVVRAMTVEDVQGLAGRYLDPRGMVWLVVGDASTQRARLGALGLGAPVAVDRDGRPAR